MQDPHAGRASHHPSATQGSARGVEIRTRTVPPRSYARGLGGQRRFAHIPGAVLDLQRMKEFAGEADFRVLEGDPVRLAIHSVALPAYTIAHIRSAPFTIEWSREDADASSRCVFVFVQCGVLEVSGTGVEWTTDGGGLCVIFPGPDPVRIRGREDGEMIFFSFDSAEIEPLSLDPHTIGPLSATSPVFRSAYAYLQAASLDPMPTPDDAQEMGILRALTRDVARSLVLASVRTRHRDRLLSEARRIIAQEYRDSQFSPTRLAAELRVSRSTLERAFRHRSLLVAQEIRRHRAHHALSLIAGDAALSTEMIARVSGFGSRSAMSRALREMDAVPPVRVHALGRDTPHG